MYTELESIDALRAHLSAHRDLHGCVIQGLDLVGESALLADVPMGGATFLGCRFEVPALVHIVETGGVVVPALDGLPYQTHRAGLYTVDELMAGYSRGQPETFHKRTLDARIYHHYESMRHRGGRLPILEALAQRLHDHAIDSAIDDLLHPGGGRRRVVGVMGGHAMRRDAAAYETVARISWRLSRAGYFVVTGGGPGAMEAANLGAWLAAHPAEAVRDAVSVLATAPTYRDLGWFDTAFSVRDRFPNGGASLAIPTWFYGHEPTNLFSAHVAKYFSNSIREDDLLAIATHGVIYAPGSAGTIQEVFMDATQNHYGTMRVVSPMVFLGASYWTLNKPIYPLLVKLAAGRQYAEMLHLADDAESIVRFIEEHPPVPYRP